LFDARNRGSTRLTLKMR